MPLIFLGSKMKTNEDLLWKGNNFLGKEVNSKCLCDQIVPVKPADPRIPTAILSCDIFFSVDLFKYNQHATKLFKILQVSRVVVVHFFNSSTWEAVSWISEISRTARTTQGDPV